MRINPSVTIFNRVTSQSTTSLPFLYQTRTLRSNRTLQFRSWNTKDAVTISAKCLLFSSNVPSSHHLKHQGIQRQYSSISDRTASNDTGRSASDRPIRVNSVKGDLSGQEYRLSDRRDYPHSKSQRGRASATFTDESTEEDIPWNNDPREERNDNVVLTTEPAGLFAGDEHDSESVPWNSSAFPLEGEPYIDEDEVTDYSAGVTHRSEDSTITIAERRAFDRIFEELIRSRQSSLFKYPADSETMAVPTNSGGNTGQSNGKARLASIMESALKIKSVNEVEASLYSQTSIHSEEQARQAVDRYPLALRAQAAKAMGLVSKPIASEIDSFDDSEVVQGIRQRERTRVESLMRAAATDAELWEVMEREVFSIVNKIGLEPKQEFSKSEKKKQRSRKKRDIVTTELFTEKVLEASSDGIAKSENDSEAPIVSKPSDLNIYGPLYPEYLLLGLRLLDRSFSKPSQLIQNILPRVRSLGVISQVLGASTALYNELLRVAWFRLDDFQGVITMLTEMEAAGLDLDTETFEIVNDIVAMQARVKRGVKGAALQALWQMPEFAPGKFAVWRDKIQKGIKARESEYVSSQLNDVVSEYRKQIGY